MSIHRAHAIVLRTRKVRESSKIVVLFTNKFGRISAIAKGSLKPKSKFGSSLELFTRCSIIFYRKENRELQTLSHSETLESYQGIKDDVFKLAYASVAAEMVERLMPVEEPNEALFGLLASTLAQIDVASRTQLEVILSSYELKTLYLVGYGPELVKCVRCGKAVDEEASFGLLSGGVLCPDCRNRDLNALGMSPEALALLREYRRESIEKLRKTHSAGEVSREVADILNAFFRAQISEGAKIRSLDFLERIRDTSFGGQS
jgi:DNA repair protein RecO (recombination protein O)